MKHLLLVSVAILAFAGTAHAQKGSFNGNGNSGFFNGNFNGNGAGNGSGVGLGVGIANSTSNAAAASVASATGGTASATGGTSSASFNEEKQAPGIGLAGLAVGGLSCRGSMSVGASFPGGGFGFGTSTPDDECERRQWAGMLASVKDPRARALAWAIMQRSAVVQQAMQDTGMIPVVVGVTPRTVGNSGCHKWSGGALGVGQCVY